MRGSSKLGDSACKEAENGTKRATTAAEKSKRRIKTPF
jgi:hypothetical protein